MPDVNLSLNSWNRFLTRYLVIAPDLVGAVHDFTYRDCKIKIQLPSKQYIQAGPLEGEVLSFNAYKEVDGKKIPSNFHVHSVEVLIFISEPVLVTDAILNQSPNAYELVPKVQQKELDRAAKDQTAIAEGAFDLWIRTLRWKCDNSAIGRREIMDHKSGWSTHLQVHSSGQPIWAWHEPLKWVLNEVITTGAWNDTGDALKSGIRPPVFVDLMHDASEHLRLGDRPRAVIDMAVACESYIRILVESSLPAGLNASVKKYIDETNIRTVLTRFLAESLNEAERRALHKVQKQLHKIFDARNQILHSGQIFALESGECLQLLEATRTLLTLRSV